ncbi:MAG: quorum-sensing autoinducer CAI-1 synthase [Deltaproteobacteria bacterium]|nr:quorum-sensing autoinducer CAI-1 synthase [Deltaproteobacteria bacterium]
MNFENVHTIEDTESAYKLLSKKSSYIEWQKFEVLNVLPLMKASPREDSVKLYSNDYLSLSQHPKILASQIQSIQHMNEEIMMSGVFLNNVSQQGQLEKKMAHFLKSEETILCQSGYFANLGLIQALAEPGMVIHIDENAHCSLWEGAIRSGARIFYFKHNDVSHLQKKIHQFGPGLIVIDSVYSTLGAQARLEEIVEIGVQNNCIMVVDESHSLGTHGSLGEGLVAELGLEEKVHFRTASLSKSFVCRAGIITCLAKYKHYITHSASPFIFSSALQAHEIARIDAVLEEVKIAHEQRKLVKRNTHIIRKEIEGLGIHLLGSEQIIPLIAGTKEAAFMLRDFLEERNVFGAIFIPPATAKDHCMVRLSVHAALKESEISYLLEVIKKAKKFLL